MEDNESDLAGAADARITALGGACTRMPALLCAAREPRSSYFRWRRLPQR